MKTQIQLYYEPLTLNLLYKDIVVKIKLEEVNVAILCYLHSPWVILYNSCTEEEVMAF